MTDQTHEYIAVICFEQENGSKYFCFEFSNKKFVDEEKWEKSEYYDLIEEYILCKENENNELYKNILENFSKFYVQINPTFFKDIEKTEEIEVSEEDSPKIFIEMILKKDYDIDIHVLNIMKFYGIDNVRGGSFLEDNIDDVIEKYRFCKDCRYGERDCYCHYVDDSDNESEFYCECCYEKFFTLDSLKKHEIEIRERERISEKNHRCVHCGGSHYEKSCDWVTSWPNKVSILGDIYYSDSD